MQTLSINPLSEIMPGAKCERCFDSGIWLTPRNLVAVCPQVQLGHPHQVQNPESFIFERAVRRLNEMNMWINPMCFELARVLTHFNTQNPCSREDLFHLFFSETNLSQNQQLRKFHGLIEDLRKVWLMPVGSRKDSPSGYWIIADLNDFKSWVNRAKSAPITQLSTIHKVARHNFPVFAEQMELEFWNDMEVSK